MRARFRGLALGATVVGLVAVPTAHATVPPYLTEQGRLFDTSNNPISGSTTFVFSLYTAATGGTALWTETQTITLDSGFFSTQLGSVTAIPAGTFQTAVNASQNLYLGIKVNADAELSPRQPLSSVPYALLADNAVGDITPHSISVNGQTVVNSSGAWVGATTGLQGPPGPAGPGGTMGTGLGGGVALTTTATTVNTPTGPATGYHTYLNQLTVSVPASATKCFVTSSGAFCGGQPGINSGVAVAYAQGNGTFADYNGGAGACWLGPLITGANNTTSVCSSCAAFAVINVTGGGSYSFGCDVITFNQPTSAMTGACQANAVCF